MGCARVGWFKLQARDSGYAGYRAQPLVTLLVYRRLCLCLFVSLQEGKSTGDEHLLRRPRHAAGHSKINIQPCVKPLGKSQHQD